MSIKELAATVAKMSGKAVNIVELPVCKKEEDFIKLMRMYKFTYTETSGIPGTLRSKVIHAKCIKPYSISSKHLHEIKKSLDDLNAYFKELFTDTDKCKSEGINYVEFYITRVYLVRTCYQDPKFDNFLGANDFPPIDIPVDEFGDSILGYNPAFDIIFKTAKHAFRWFYKLRKNFPEIRTALELE